MVTNCTTENISDTKQVSISIEKHKELTGRYPTEYGYDKGGHSPGNHQLLKAIMGVISMNYRNNINI